MADLRLGGQDLPFRGENLLQPDHEVSGALRRLGCHARVRGSFFADGAIDPWPIHADIGVVGLCRQPLSAHDHLTDLDLW